MKHADLPTTGSFEPNKEKFSFFLRSGRSFLFGLLAVMLGALMILSSHTLLRGKNEWLCPGVEVAGLVLMAGGAAFGFVPWLRQLSGGFEKESRERRRVEGILRLQRDLAVTISSARDVQSALERSLDISFLLEGVDCGGIYLSDDENGGLRLVAHRGFSEEFVRDKAFYTADDPFALLVNAGKPAFGEYRQLQEIIQDEVIAAEGLKAVAIIPMRSEGRVVACLNLGSRTKEQFSDGIEEAFHVAASMLTGAIERLRSSAALQQSEERFRTMAEFTHDLEYWIGADGNMVFISPSCEHQTGYTRAEFQANPNLPDLIVHPDDRVFLSAHRFGKPERSSCEAEFRIVTRSGEIRWIAHVCVPVYGTDGRFMGRRASNRDVTARKQAEQTLRQERNLFVSGPVVMFQRRSDEDWSIEYVSPNVSQFGYKPEHFYEKRVTGISIIHPEDRDRVVAERQLYIQTGVAGYEQEYRMQKADGEVRWVYDVTRMARNEAGGITHFHGYILDITERRLAEEKLRESEHGFRLLAAENERLLEQAREDAKTKATLLQEVNHRVKNNLSSIIGLLRAEERFVSCETDQETRFRDMAERISGLAEVHALLSAVEWRPIPLDKLARHIIGATARLAPGDKRIKVEVSASKAEANAKEANSLALIFNELTMNAIKHGFMIEKRWQ